MKHARAVLVAALALAAMPVTAAEARFGDETLRKGDSGRDVKTLQRTLNDAGYETDVDGEFGPHTQKRVRAFEGNEERRVDGRVTPSDARALKAAAERGPDESADDEPGTTQEAPGDEASVGEDGFAIAPADAPQAVKDVIAAGNEIAKKPYKYGGGHGKLRDSGYDCSGSVSYAPAQGGPDGRVDALGRDDPLGRARARRLDHRLRQLRPRVHGGRGHPLRHQRAQALLHPLDREGPLVHAATGRATPRASRPQLGPSTRVLTPEPTSRVPRRQRRGNGGTNGLPRPGANRRQRAA